MATVTKDFKIKSGLIVEGTTATVNNYDILTKDPTDQSYITNLVGGSGSSTNTADTLVLRDSNGDFAAGTITAETGFSGNLTGDVTGDVTGTVSDISNHNTDALGEGTTNLYFTDARAQSAMAGLYDPAGSASAAQTAAESYTDTREAAITTAYQTYADTAESDAVTTANAYTDAREIAITTAYQTYADTAEADAIATAAADATAKDTALSTALQTYADTAEADANAYTDSLIGDATVDGTGGNTITDRIATAVANLVDAAPGTLDTLNELAAAIGDDANFVTTITTSIGEKVAKSGDTMTGALVLSGAPTLALHAATKQYVDDAEAAANTYTDGEISTLQTSLQTYADTAESDAVTTANAYTDGQITTVNSTIGALDTDDIAEGLTNLYFTDERAQDAIGAAITNGTQTNITVTYDDANNVYNFVAENGVADSDTDDLVEGATNLYFTDERAQDAVATAIAAGTHSNITISYDDVNNSISFTAENGVADSTTDDLTEGSTNLYFTDARAVSALEAVVPNFTEVDINSVATQVAATQTVATASQVVGYSFDSGTYRSAKFLVKIETGTHTEVSEVLVTLDSSNNIAITEYAVVGTNGSLSTITAGMNSTNVELLVTTANNNSDVTVMGTLLV